MAACKFRMQTGLLALLLCMVAVNASAQIGRWTLDETSGLVAADIVNNNDGVYRNGVTLSQPAACPNTVNAAYFDGFDDYVEVPHIAAYLLDEGTVTFWARADAIGGRQGLWTKDSQNRDTGGQLRIVLTNSGVVEVRLQSTTSDNFATHATAIVAGDWFHVSFSWGPAGMVLNIDALNPAINPYTGGLGLTSGGAGNFEPITIGTNSDTSDDLLATPNRDNFAGHIDDVRLYDYALTLPEIQALAICAPVAAPLNIVKRAYWPDGTSIPSGATVPIGVGFKFLLYINNQDIARTDVSIRDVLDAAFQYQAGTIQADNSVAECAAAVCTVAEEQAIFTAVDGAAFLSDAVDGDVASYTGASTSVDAGDGNVGNAQLDVNANAVWAILFSVKMP